MAAIALMIKRVELDFADPALEFTCGRERSRRQSGNNRNVGEVAIAKLRDDVSAAINYNRQLRFRFLQKVAQYPVQVRDILNCQNGNPVHAVALWFCGCVGGSTGIATGGAAVCGTS